MFIFYKPLHSILLSVCRSLSTFFFLQNVYGSLYFFLFSLQNVHGSLHFFLFSFKMYYVVLSTFFCFFLLGRRVTRRAATWPKGNPMGSSSCESLPSAPRRTSPPSRTPTSTSSSTPTTSGLGERRSNRIDSNRIEWKPKEGGGWDVGGVGGFMEHPNARE